MAIADQFRGFNLRDPGTMPLLAKLVLLLGVFILLLGAAYAVDWRAQWEDLEAQRAEEARLKSEYRIKKTQAINLELYRAQVREIETSFGTLLKQLPNKSQMESLIVEINQAGLGRGLQFELFKPAPQETLRDFYAELPISLRIAGKYHDMGAFTSDIAQLSRIVTLNDLALAVTREGNLVMDTTARTFRYLDEDEVAAQRKAAEAAKAAKK